MTPAETERETSGRTAVIAALALLYVVVISGVLVVQHADELDQRRGELVGRAESLVRTAEAGMEASDRALGHSDAQATVELLAGLFDIRYIQLFDASGRIAAHSVVERVGMTPDPVHLALVGQARTAPVTEWNDDARRMNHFSAVTVMTPRGPETCVVEVSFDTTRLFDDLALQLRSQILLFLFASLVLVLVTWLGLRQLRSVGEARRLAERSAKRLGEIVERSHGEVYVFDAVTLRFEYVNDGAQENLGYGRDELLNMTAADIKADHSRSEIEAMVAPLRSGEASQLRFETRHARKDGSRYPVLISLSLSENEDRPVFVAIATDLTDRQRVEAELRQAQKMEAVGQLSAGIAHDFNNLLTSIQGATDLIRMEDEARRFAEEVDEIRLAVGHASALTRKLLAFGRRQQNAPTRLDLSQRVADTVPMLRRLIPESSRIDVERLENGAFVDLDPSNLEQILTNLVINAHDAIAERGQIRIGVERVRDEQGGPEVVTLVVSDNGEGMDPTVLERVREPFFTTKPPGSGTGLGLSTVDGIVRQAGGTLDIESGPSEGTVVRITLPAALAKPEHSEENQPALTLEQPPAHARILICEDEAMVRATVVRALRSRGYTLLEAAEPDQALALLEDGAEADLLLSDVIMPGMTGFEMATRARLAQPSLRVLFMSGYMSSQHTPGRSDWPDAVIIDKPFRIDELLIAIERALREDAPAEADRRSA